MRNFFSDWNLRRIVYLIGGIWIVAQSVMDKMWILIPFGLYFVAMSVFKFVAIVTGKQIGRAHV